MITRENRIKLDDVSSQYALLSGGQENSYKDALFFDLEHYVYKKPICLGVFGCCHYEASTNELVVQQFMIENKEDSVKILYLARDYFINMIENNNKKSIVTFSGNNDFTVINYLFTKHNIEMQVEKAFIDIDLQKQYEKIKGNSIGLKALEREFGIVRDSELISGSNLAKTFSKIIKDKDYANRMPEAKKDKILLYNEQDVVSLFHIFINWNAVIRKDEE